MDQKMGDLNARNTAWNCITSNARGIALLKLCLKNNIHIVTPESPTHFPKRGLPSIIDMFLIKNINKYNEPSSLPILNSDHNPIQLKVYLEKKLNEIPNKLNVEKISLRSFHKIINEKTNLNFEIKTNEDIDFKIIQFTKTINQALKESTTSIIREDSCIKLPSYISKDIKQKNK